MEVFGPHLRFPCCSRELELEVVKEVQLPATLSDELRGNLATLNQRKYHLPQQSRKLSQVLKTHSALHNLLHHGAGLRFGERGNGGDHYCVLGHLARQKSPQLLHLHLQTGPVLQFAKQQNRFRLQWEFLQDGHRRNHSLLFRSIRNGSVCFFKKEFDSPEYLSISI